MIAGAGIGHVIVDGETEQGIAAVTEDVALQHIGGIEEHIAWCAAGEVFADQPGAGAGLPLIIQKGGLLGTVRRRGIRRSEAESGVGNHDPHRRAAAVGLEPVAREGIVFDHHLIAVMHRRGFEIERDTPAHGIAQGVGDARGDAQVILLVRHQGIAGLHAEQGKIVKIADKIIGIHRRSALGQGDGRIRDRCGIKILVKNESHHLVDQEILLHHLGAGIAGDQLRSKHILFQGLEVEHEGAAGQGPAVHVGHAARHRHAVGGVELQVAVGIDGQHPVVIAPSQFTDRRCRIKGDRVLERVHIHRFGKCDRQAVLHREGIPFRRHRAGHLGGEGGDRIALGGIGHRRLVPVAVEIGGEIPVGAVEVLQSVKAVGIAHWRVAEADLDDRIGVHIEIGILGTVDREPVVLGDRRCGRNGDLVVERIQLVQAEGRCIRHRGADQAGGADLGFSLEEQLFGGLPVVFIAPGAVAEELHPVGPGHTADGVDDRLVAPEEVAAGEIIREQAHRIMPSRQDRRLDELTPATWASAFQHIVDIAGGAPVVVHPGDLVDVALVKPQGGILVNAAVALPAAPVVAAQRGR